MSFAWKACWTISVLLVSAPYLSESCRAEEMPPLKAYVKVKGLRIVDEVDETDGDRMRPFNWTKGTTIALHVGISDGELVALYDDDSKLTAVTDDKGGDLRGTFGSFVKFSDDGKKSLLEIEAPKIPTKGANSLTISGQAAFVVGFKRQEFSVDNVAVKKGTALRLGTIALEIARVGKPQWRNAGFAIEFQTTRPLISIAEFEFFDSEGNALHSDVSGSSRSYVDGKVIFHQEFVFKETVANIKVVTVQWTDLKEIKVPLNVPVTLGSVNSSEDKAVEINLQTEEFEE